MTHVFGTARPAAVDGGDSTPVTESPANGHSGHEQVVFCQDAPTGLRAIIAIYSTRLGPALGGTRFYPYPSEDAALADVLNLSRAMAYKNALAGLDLGGGKAVIIGDPARLKSEALLRAYGRFVQSLNGRYVTACDVGTYSEDMDIIARECTHVTGRTVPNGGAGDSSVLTAFGVFQGMRAAAEHVWGDTSLAGRRVAVEGVGKVGQRLVGHLFDAGARVTICDVAAGAVERVRAEYPAVDVAASRTELAAGKMDIYSPCALGGSIDDDTVATLAARIICGGANNQLAHPGIEKQLAEPRHRVRPGLPGERRRSDPGGGRVRRLQLRPGAGPGGENLRHDQADSGRGGRRGRTARGGRRPDCRAPDVRGRKAAQHLARGMTSPVRDARRRSAPKPGTVMSVRRQETRRIPRRWRGVGSVCCA